MAQPGDYAHNELNTIQAITQLKAVARFSTQHQRPHSTQHACPVTKKVKEEEVFKTTRRDYTRYLRFIVNLLSTPKTDLALRID
jgi:hypothetical protein